MDIALKLLTVLSQVMSRRLGDYTCSSSAVTSSAVSHLVKVHMLVCFMRQSSMQSKAFMKV